MIYYINSATGSDIAGNDGSITEPWATWAYAVTREVASGDTVDISGTLTEIVDPDYDAISFTGAGTIDSADLQSIFVDGDTDGTDKAVSVEGLTLTGAVFGIPTVAVREGTGLLINTVKAGVGQDYVTRSIAATITNAISNTNEKHGFDVRGNINATFSGCYASGNGTGTTGHGFSSHPVKDTPTTGYVLDSGTTYYYDCRGTATHVARSSVQALKAGTRPLSQWEYESDGTRCYFDIGEDPEGLAMAFVISTGSVDYDDCETTLNVDFNKDKIEGQGISFDDSFSTGTINNCYSHDNEGRGFAFRASKDIKVTNSISYNDSRESFHAASGALDITIQNNVAIGGLRGFYLINTVDINVSDNVAGYCRLNGFSGTNLLGTNVFGTNYAYSNFGSNFAGTPGTNVTMEGPLTDTSGTELSAIDISAVF